MPKDFEVPPAGRGQPQQPPFGGNIVMPSPARSGGAAGWILLLVVLLAAGFIGFRLWKTHTQAAQGPGGMGGPGGPGGRGGGAAFPVSVILGTVNRTNMPIFLDGLGTVQAFNTVAVRSQVDGQVTNIAFVEGQEVKKGDVLAQIDSAPFLAQVEQMEAKKAQDEAQLANANIELRRDGALLKDKIYSQDVFDSQEALVRQLSAAVQADQAAVDNSRVQLGYTTIRAPIEGRAGIRLVDQGNIVHASDATGIVGLTQLRPISVVFTLPEQNLSQIQRHSSETLKVVALDRDNLTALDTGELAVIDNQIDTTTGTIKLKATFPNRDLHLWPGQFINARLFVTTRTNGLIVPAAVIQRGPSGDYAFVVGDDLTAQVRPVKVARIVEEVALIDDGLQAGEKVVVDGQYKLQAGSKISTGGGEGRGGGRGGRGGDRGGNRGGDRGAERGNGTNAEASKN